MRGQGATNVIATTASEAKKGKDRTKEGFVAKTLKITDHRNSLKLIDSWQDSKKFNQQET